MNNDQPFNPPNVEQSWIVLDDNGWVSASRPPTASPSRPLRQEDDDEDDELRVPKRLGMDRDVREALEMAERSLELAASSDNFAFRRLNRGSSDEERSSVNGSPSSKVNNGSGFTEESYPENKYNGRGPPTISNTRRGLVITTDSEHIAFQNIKLVSSDPRPETPTISLNGPPLAPKEPSTFKVVSSPGPSRVVNAPNPAWNSSDNHIETSNASSLKTEGDDSEGSFLHWAFGVPGNSSLVPLVFSHMVTLLVGFYIGTRRSTSTPSTNSGGSSSVGSQCISPSNT